jgi:uncharacterized Zn-binding protein involved in type VI secretion
MPPAARVGDPTNHPGIIGSPGVLSVLIGGQPAAVGGAVGGTLHVCALPPLAGGPHPQTPLIKGSATVRIGGRAAARMGDTAACGATIVQGLPSVLIGG